MNIIKIDDDLLQKDLSSVLENFFKGYAEYSSSADTGTWTPEINIKEEADRFVVCANLPEVNQEDISISLDNNILTLQGERKIEPSEYTRTERSRSQFYRRFSLPQTADDAHITAQYQQGVLEIIIPKREPKLSNHIEIL